MIFWLISEKLRFLTILGFCGRFLAISFLVLRNDWVYSICFFRDINSFEYLLFENTATFFEALFSQNRFLTELVSPTSAVHFSFQQFFTPNFLPFCSLSNFKFSFGCSFQWWELLVDIFLHLWEIGMQILGTTLKKLQFWVARVYFCSYVGWRRGSACSEMTPKPLIMFSFCIYNSLFLLCV